MKAWVVIIIVEELAIRLMRTTSSLALDSRSCLEILKKCLENSLEAVLSMTFSIMLHITVGEAIIRMEMAMPEVVDIIIIAHHTPHQTSLKCHHI